MITFCKLCGSALDETQDGCECGAANPHAGESGSALGAFDEDRLGDALGDTLRSGSSESIEKALLGLGGLDLCAGVFMLLTFTVTPWSALAAPDRALYMGTVLFGVVNLCLVFYADLEKRPWRLMAGLVIAIHFVALLLIAS